ncbi:hypothetical protein ACFQT0_31275 [Hymenobacter humi]|uniref:Uncharacterized protein n=1 Tax=Hymenobacter humi TaxID=1411620 RepID=A0ABW2UCU3_9BACT
MQSVHPWVLVVLRDGQCVASVALAPAGAAGLHERFHGLTQALANLDAGRHPGLPVVRERLQARARQREQVPVAELHARLVRVLHTTLRQLR